jgi:hypothetical protein
MLDHDTRGHVALPVQITRALELLWTRYAVAAPSDVRTELRGNMVTCVLVDAVQAFDTRTAAAPAEGPGANSKLSLLDYQREAVGVIVRLTRQRVSAFLSSHDRDTDVATEIFELEPSLRDRNPTTRTHHRGPSAELVPPRPATRSWQT